MDFKARTPAHQKVFSVSSQVQLEHDLLKTRTPTKATKQAIKTHSNDLLSPCLASHSPLLPLLTISTDHSVQVNEYIKQMVNAKQALPQPFLISLTNVFSLCTQDTYNDLVLSLKRLFLRSPEVAIRATARYKKLTKDQFKSNNPVIREAALDFFSALTQKASEDIAETTDVILKFIWSKGPTPEQKSLAFQVLHTFPVAQSQKITDSVLTNVSKENQELVMVSAFACLTIHLDMILGKHDLDSKSASKNNGILFLVKSLKDAKPVVRKSALKALSDISVSCKDVVMADGLVDTAISVVAKSAEKPGDPNDGLLQGYQALDILLTYHSLAPSPKILKVLATAMSGAYTTERFYAKLGDYGCVVRVICALVVLNVDFHEQLCGLFVWLFVNAPTPARRTMIQIVSDLSSTHFRTLTDISLKGLDIALRAYKEPEALVWDAENKPVRSSKSFAARVVGCLFSILPTSTESKDEVKKCLEDLLVVCSHPFITKTAGTDLWMRLSWRCGIHPNFISEEFIDSLLVFESRSMHGGFTDAFYRQATIDALAVCVRCVPDVVVSKCVEFAETILTEDEYTFTADEVLVYKSPADVLVNDPTRKHVDTKGMTAEQLWEHELKLELERKSGVKHTPAQKKMYADQLLVESEIRARVTDGVLKLNAALDVLGVVLGCHAIENVTRRLGVLLSSVVVREFSGGDLVGSKSAGLLYALADAVLGPCVGELRTGQICCALLCVLGVETTNTCVLPSQYMVGTVPGISCVNVEIVVKVLAGVSEHVREEGVLNTHSFTFIFAIVEAVVLKRGVCVSVGDKTYTEMVMAASDVLLAHAAVEGDLPRSCMVSCLLELLETYPRLRVACKDALLALSSATAHLEFEQQTEETELVISGVVSELLEGLVSVEEGVREACLASLVHLPIPEPLRDLFDVRVWVLRCDDAEKVMMEADGLWTDAYDTNVISADAVPQVLELVVHTNAPIRAAAGRALNDILEEHTELVEGVLSDLYAVYVEKAQEPIPLLDEYGMVIPESLNKPDEFEARSGVALALLACAGLISKRESIIAFFEFLVNSEALGDRNTTVSGQMLKAGLAVLGAHGRGFIKELLDMFDGFLSGLDGASESQDRIRTSLVILLGNLAAFLDPADARIIETVDTLIETLKTPSEVVQVAVSECLPGLIKVNKSQVGSLVKLLLDMLFTSEKYGDRRGAAYGLAGVVKGYGVSALKDHLIMAHLREAVEDKRHVNRREGALFAYETLSFTLGRIFEPYMIQILPYLLVCYGDNNKTIRDATEDTCRVIMSKLSAHCVKLLLPSLLNGLQERAFRTKIGAIEVMASMSSLAPKQLGASLPTVVPKICEALGDSHQKVQEAAREALKQFGSVIKNPEIQELVPTLIAALVDPNRKTLPALSALLDTTFVHYIDAPSLALLVPIIDRGMKERSAETKKKAAQIVGNMASLTEARDLVPYLATLLPPLHEVLVDPVPDARGTAAHAFGTLVAKLGEDRFPGLVNELLATLQSETSGVDRSGAAQGLSEILSGLGVERLEGLLPEIINNANSVKSHTREGFTTLLVYLPNTFGERFTPYIAKIVPTMLEGLADEIDTVREAALHVGKVIVRNYAKSAVHLLLPQLEKGLFHDNWRIRQNSVQLIGDLLFRIAGVSHSLDTSETEGEGTGTESHRVALRAALGEDRFDAVLASIFIVRADSSGLVRSSAVGVWQAIVTNTPKMLKSILPTLMSIILSSLASSSFEKRNLAARTLGDLVRRLGDAMLNMIVPIFAKGLESEDAVSREGVCIGLSEMVSSAGKNIVPEFLFQCLPFIKKALVDPSAEVRGAAAQAFDVFHQNLGAKAIDEVIPGLLAELKSDTTGVALEGLKEIMAVRSNVVFPVLIPTLLSPPITSVKAQALSSLISVAGAALNRRLDVILPTLMDALETEEDAVEDIKNTLEIIMTSIEDDGVYRVMGILTETILEGSIAQQVSACDSLALFFGGTEESFDDYVPDMLTLLTELLTHDSELLVKACWNCLDVLVKRLPKEELVEYVRPLRKGIRNAEQHLGYGELIPGFNLTKGLMNGTPEIRELSAYSMGDLITRTSDLSLKPFVTQITGPLIRVIGDRFPANVKTAILSTLGLLLSKVPLMLKPFLPQLQRTFVKSLSEQGSTSAMRNRTAQCLSLLIPLQVRLDPLVTELVQGIKTSEAEVQIAIWDALYHVLHVVSRKSAKNISEASTQNVQALIMDSLCEEAEGNSRSRAGAAKCFGALCNAIDVEVSRELLAELVSTDLSTEEYGSTLGMLNAIERVYFEASETLENEELEQSISTALISCFRSQKPIVTEAAVAATGQIMLRKKLPSPLLDALIETTLPSDSVEARKGAIEALKNVAKQDFAAIEPILPKLVPALMTSVRDRTIPIKLAAERALVYALQIKDGGATLEKYLKKVDAQTARSLGDYARRVLVKVSERESEDEE